MPTEPLSQQRWLSLPVGAFLLENELLFLSTTALLSRLPVTLVLPPLDIALHLRPGMNRLSFTNGVRCSFVSVFC